MRDGDRHEIAVHRPDISRDSARIIEVLLAHAHACSMRTGCNTILHLVGTDAWLVFDNVFIAWHRADVRDRHLLLSG